MVLTSWCPWVPWYSLYLLLLCRRVSLHSLWTVEQGVFFREAFYALMFVWAGGIVAGAVVVEVVAYFGALF